MLGPSLILNTQGLGQTPFKFQTRSGKTALRWLQNRSLGFSRIYLDPSSWDEDFLTLVREARVHRPVTPITILGNSDGLSSVDLTRLGISGRTEAGALTFDPTRENQPLSQTSSLIEDGEFMGVPVAEFLELDQVGFDLFMKSPAGKWIMLAQANEPGIGERIRTYWNRGLNFLFIHRHTMHRQLDAIQMFGNLLAGSTSASGILKTAQSIREVSRVLEGIRIIEQVNRDAWDSIAESMLKLHRFWDSGPWSDPQTALRNAPLLDHSLSVVVLAQLLGRELGFESQENAIRLGLAAAFHDIGLLDLGFTIPPEENPALATPPLNAAQKQALLDHPTKGAHWISEHFAGETIIAQSVALHHWRRDGSGFYAQGAQPVLNPPRMAEILGVCELAAFDLFKSPFGATAGWADRLASRLGDQFSAPVLHALRQAFEPRITL